MEYVFWVVLELRPLDSRLVDVSSFQRFLVRILILIARCIQQTRRKLRSKPLDLRWNYYLSYISRDDLWNTNPPRSTDGAVWPRRSGEHDKLGRWRDSGDGKFRPPLPAVSQFRPGKSIYVSVLSRFQPRVTRYRSVCVSPGGNRTAAEDPAGYPLVPDIVIYSNSLPVCFPRDIVESVARFVSRKLNVLTRAINCFGRNVVHRRQKHFSQACTLVNKVPLAKCTVINDVRA